MLLESHGQGAFFQVAATLIPVLIFGGVLAERRGPSLRDSTTRYANFATYVPIIGAAAVLAELMSINALVISKPVPGWWIAFVSAVLTGGLVGVILAVWLPWMAAYRRRDPRRASKLRNASIGLLVLLSFAAVWLVTDAVEGANESQEAQARLEEETQLSRNCLRMSNRANSDLERATRETEGAFLRSQADRLASIEIDERLLEAKLEGAPPALMSFLRQRKRQMNATSRIDAIHESSLLKQVSPILHRQDKSYRCSALRRFRESQ